MARTKQEVRDFLNSQVGQRVNAKSGIYSGQCVSLIKALLEFLGAPNPYAGRGNAITVDDQLLREGIAQNGIGWLTIVVNRSMGRIFENGVWNNYGHIWVDLQNEANFEQNGARALYTTKNTRPIQQGQQFVNLDKYITGDEEIMDNPQDIRNIGNAIWGRPVDEMTVNNLKGKSWHDVMYYFVAAFPWTNRVNAEANTQKALSAATGTVKLQATQIEEFKKAQLSNQALVDENKKLTDKVAKYENQDSEDKASADTLLRRLGQFLSKYWTTK